MAHGGTTDFMVVFLAGTAASLAASQEKPLFPKNEAPEEC